MTSIEDDFKLLKVLGKGNFATVYLGTYLENNKNYAIKSIKKDRINGSQGTILALINEIKIMRKLNHPSLLKLHKVYESNSHVHLILDYIEGGSLLTRLLTKKTFSEEIVAKLGFKLLEVLKYMHSLKIVHRDIKLENILMISKNNDYEFKLADFGLATEVKGNLLQRCGSPGYVAPEILRKCPYGTKADMFSTGILFYALLSGRMPFDSKGTKEIILQNRECIIGYPDKFWNNISRDAISLIQRLTEIRPEKRLSAIDAVEHVWFFLSLRKTYTRISNKYLSSTSVTNQNFVIRKPSQRVQRIDGLIANVVEDGMFTKRNFRIPPLPSTLPNNSNQIFRKSTKYDQNIVVQKQ